MRITKFDARSLFGNPEVPHVVWEKQFDGFDAELRRIARKPWQDICESDLWYYMHDLAYVSPLQESLFEYLFPACLNFWYDTMMRNEDASIGSIEFHYSLHQGKILTRMLSSHRRDLVLDFVVDGFLNRIESDKLSLPFSDETDYCSWMLRLNSIGLVFPVVERIWENWWRVDSYGKAVCAMAWCSGIVYEDDENLIFGSSNIRSGDSEPYLHENDSQIRNDRWMDENIRFMYDNLSVKYIKDKLLECSRMLDGCKEGSTALEIHNESKKRPDLMQHRIHHLLSRL